MVVGLATDPFEVDVYDIIEGKAPYDVVEAKTKSIISSLSVRAGVYRDLVRSEHKTKSKRLWRLAV